jgi:predicted Zn-dependent protease
MWIQLAALGLGLVNEQVEDENANAIIALVGQFGSLAWQNGYGRSHEDQADRVGLRYAYEAGFDITKGPQLWRRFAQKYGQEDVVQNFFFSDHSLASKRAAHLERELALNYPNGSKQMSRPAPVRRASAKAPAPTRAPGEITAGMSMDEVLALLGRPGDQLTFGRRARWVYQDMTVVFEGGRVTDVQL